MVAQWYPPKAYAFRRARQNGRDLLAGSTNLVVMYYTYALYSKSQNKFYIGSTNDLKRRILEHQGDKVHTTLRMNNPKLVYYEACISKTDAQGREKQLKTGFGRGYLRRRLENFLKTAL
ncbi:MAG: GIY-YIG nuclease family protein [Candidatus Wildermuthbacteria bacterium]|nr:GIY-YIG nuclease family protein [Candidatus Wildermuthbacteria bacterium]